MQVVDIKRAHHYVWRHYLEAWEVDGRLCCLRDGKAKPINAVNLAVEKDFYRLPELNEAELQFAILFAKSMPSHGEKVFKGFLKYSRLTLGLDQPWLTISALIQSWTMPLKFINRIRKKTTIRALKIGRYPFSPQ